MTNLLRWTLAATAQAAAVNDWDAIYWALLPRVYNFLRYRVGDDTAAEDLTAATFVKAWEARDRYRHDRSGFSTWTFVIARNAAIDYLRQQRNHLSIEAVAELRTALTTEEQAELHDELAWLAVVLEQLTPRERELIALKYGSELTNRAIADVTGLSESNVGTILHRALQKLRKSWDANHE